ncbi:MAG TPA: histidine kinase dimerization/phospho-acceptor domain-containing protein [Lachnospiraceae bacterium]
MGKYRFKTITGKMTFYLLLGSFIALLIFVPLFKLSNRIMDDYFTGSDYIYRKSSEKTKKFQDFVKEDKIKATDTEEIRAWARDNKISYFTISRDRLLLFDNSYDGRVPLKDTESEQLHNTWQFFQTVMFADGEADVFIYDNYVMIHYVTLSILLSIFCFSICLFVFLRGLKKEVNYIKCLNREVEVIQRGELDSHFTIKGRDEIAGLAKGLDDMRRSLIEKEMQKSKMKTAQDKLVLGMAHDIRTPLTSLMNYQEVIRRQNKNEDLDRPIRIAIDKTCQIRDLSEQLFEFFLVNCDREIPLEDAEEIEFILSDYCSELCSTLQEMGFEIDFSNLKWSEGVISISYDFLGRIINNIVSNIEKYAKKGSQISLSSIYKEGYIGLAIRNEIGEGDDKIKGNKIGVENIKMMMQKMRGGCEIFSDVRCYQMILWFPLQKVFQ